MKRWWWFPASNENSLLAQGILLLLTSSLARALTFFHSDIVPCLVPVSISYYPWAVAPEFSMRRAAADRCPTWVMLLMIPKGTLPYSASRTTRSKTKRNSVLFIVKDSEQTFLHIRMFYSDLARNAILFILRELTKVSSYIYFVVYLEHLSKWHHFYAAQRNPPNVTLETLMNYAQGFLTGMLDLLLKTVHKSILCKLNNIFHWQIISQMLYFHFWLIFNCQWLLTL